MFEKSDQIEFFRQVKETSGLDRDALGNLVGIVGRSYSDWANGKLFPKEDGIRFLSRKFGVEIPRVVERREEWWSGRINGSRAAIVQVRKYGPPGSIESRRNGGIVSQQRRRENPEYYRSLGCVVANSFVKPRKFPALAEFVGIVLGDGCLTRDQCQITLSYEDDKKYATYVARLIWSLFAIKPGIFEYPNYGCLRVIVSGVNFVKMMTDFGQVVGNKVVHQVKIPSWIENNHTFYKACIRGLFDTDGGTFTHRHWVGGHKYRHFGLTFTSSSRPLLESFHYYLGLEDIKRSVREEHLFVYDLSCVMRFFEIVRPANPKHLERLERHLSISTRLV